MASIANIDDYVLLTIDHNGSSAMIYIQQPVGLTFFQIDMIESFFKRMVFYTGVGTNININIDRLKNGEVSIVGYFYNTTKDYDFSVTYENVFIALHNALSTLFDLAINNQGPYNSINKDGVIDDDDFDDLEDFDDLDNKDIPETIEEKNIKKIGWAVDDIFEGQDLFEDDNENNR